MLNSNCVTIIRLDRMLEQSGHRGNSSVNDQIHAGLWPPPVKIGARTVGWVQSEVTAVLAARIAGADDDEIRALITTLVAQREAMHPRHWHDSASAAISLPGQSMGSAPLTAACAELDVAPASRGKRSSVATKRRTAADDSSAPVGRQKGGRHE
jgi:prophage regulatory protein